MHRRKVVVALPELLREVEKTTQAERAGKRLTAVPDGTGRPGHYRMAYVPEEAPT